MKYDVEVVLKSLVPPKDPDILKAWIKENHIKVKELERMEHVLFDRFAEIVDKILVEVLLKRGTRF